MQGFSDRSPGSVKRIGDLLVEADFVALPDLERALTMAKKNFQALGKVLVSLRLATEQDVNDALIVQKACKHDGLPGHYAVRALKLKKSDNLTMPEALQFLGWTAEGYRSFDEPAEVVNAKAALQAAANSGDTEAHCRSVMALADIYLSLKLAARADILIEEANEICERSGLADLKPMIFRQFAKVAIAQKKFPEARQYFEKIQEIYLQSGKRYTQDYAVFLLDFAEFNESRRKIHDSENCYLEAASIFARLDDPRSIQAIKKASAVGQQLTRMPDQIMLGDLLLGAGVLNQLQIDEALKYGAAQKMALGRALIATKLLQENHLQLALQVQLLVRNGEISRALGHLIVQCGVKMNADLEKVLKVFDYKPKSRDQLANELLKASEEMVRLEQAMPADHPAVAVAYGNTAYLYFHRQQWMEAEQLFKRGMQILERAQTGATNDVPVFLDRYAELRVAQLEFDDAINLRKLATQLRARQEGQTSLSVAESMEKLAATFCMKGDHVSSISCIDKSIAIRKVVFGPNSTELINTLETKADCNVHRNDWEGAQAMLTRAHEICKENTTSADERSKRIVEKLINVCKTTGDRDLADQLESSVKRLNTMV